MVLWIQATAAVLFLGLAVYLARNLPRRVALVLNSLAGGVILFLVINSLSNLTGRISELARSSTPFFSLLNPWLLAGVAMLGLTALPLILIFVIGERRRSVVLAIAFGLFNLIFCLSVSADAATGLYTPGVGVGVAFLFLFLLEGVSLGALLIKGRPEILYAFGLGLTAVLPALSGFNLGSADAALFQPFAYAAAAGLMIFYLPFVLSPGRDQKDVIWQFIGMLAGLVLTGIIVVSIPLLGGSPV